MASTASEAKKIGPRVHKRRLELGLSQRDLAAPGVSYAYMSRIESGARLPSIRLLRALAPKLGVSVHYLETDSKIPRSSWQSSCSPKALGHRSAMNMLATARKLVGRQRAAELERDQTSSAA
jgi:DNA-binding XRE family transcriptional regulator